MAKRIKDMTNDELWDLYGRCIGKASIIKEEIKRRERMMGRIEAKRSRARLRLVGRRARGCASS